jgi:periplasmic protein TonB
VTSAHAEMGDERQREFRKMIAWSIAAHLFVVFGGAVMPHPSGRIDPSQVVSVDLVALPSPARASAPPKPAAPKPQEVAAVKPPPPPPPKPKEVVIPEHPERDLAKKPKPEPKKTEPAPEPEKSLEDLLSEMRQEAGEAEPTAAPPAPEETAAAEPSPSSGGTVAVSPEVLAWIRKAKAHVRRAWVVPPGFRTESLETHVTVELDASGAVVGEPQITQRSGNPWYDDGVVRGIQKASPLPPPPSAGEWDFVFKPEDAL